MKATLFKLLRILPLLWVVWITTPVPATAQCPMCKAAVESGSNGGKGNDGQGSFMVRNLNTGIIYLFVLPYSAIMLIVFVWYRAYRKRRREEAQEKMVTLESVAGIPPASNGASQYS